MASTRFTAQLAPTEKQTDSLAARIAAAASQHLRDLAALPCEAIDHFDTRLVLVSIDQ